MSTFRTRAQIAQDTIDLGFSHTGIAMQMIAKELDAIHRETFTPPRKIDSGRMNHFADFTPAEDAEPID